VTHGKKSIMQVAHELEELFSEYYGLGWWKRQLMAKLPSINCLWKPTEFLYGYVHVSSLFWSGAGNLVQTTELQWHFAHNVLSGTLSLYWLIDWHKHCRKELEELSNRLEVERNRYQVTSQHDTAISAMPHFSINDKFILNQDDASYMLSLEVQSPIDYVLLQVGSLVQYHSIKSFLNLFFLFIL